MKPGQRWQAGVIAAGGCAMLLLLTWAIFSADHDQEPPRGSSERERQVASSSRAPEHRLGELASQSDMPEFPWPPPRASAWDVIPGNLLPIVPGEPSTMGSIADRLSEALEFAGYYQRAFFRAPNGFAVVTQLERVEDDGAPSDLHRWTGVFANETPSSFSLEAYLRNLLYAYPGHYRLIVIMVTDAAFSTSDEFMTASNAHDLAARGALALDANVARAIYTAAHQCTVLIYEFLAPRTLGPKLVQPSRLPGRVHLRQSGILPGLDAARAARAGR
jgi:hypothetical protein